MSHIRTLHEKKSNQLERKRSNLFIAYSCYFEFVIFLVDGQTTQFAFIDAYQSCTCLGKQKTDNREHTFRQQPTKRTKNMNKITNNVITNHKTQSLSNIK